MSYLLDTHRLHLDIVFSQEVIQTKKQIVVARTNVEVEYRAMDVAS